MIAGDQENAALPRGCKRAVPAGPLFRQSHADWTIAFKSEIGGLLSQESRWKLMVYIGVASYGMYMLNTPVLDCLKPIFNRVGPHHPLLQFPIASASSLQD